MALAAASLVIRIGVLCPEDTGRGAPVNSPARAAAAVAAPVQIMAVHPGQQERQCQCQHWLLPMYFPALPGAGFSFPVSPVNAEPQRQNRSAAFTVSGTSRAPPARSILFCVYLV